MKRKSKKEICDKKMSFEDCELAILRAATDIAEKRIGQNAVKSPEIKRILTIVENFIRNKKLICYGGTAINNILPKQDQFYDKDVELPDYDFFSTNALENAKELADIYVKEGFIEVEAKSGQHFGTFKVFVNFIGIADITNVNKEIYKSLKVEAIQIAGMLYAPPNYLRMAMYLELSRPAGDVSRWEKVLKRLILLNKNYPLKSEKCKKINFQREMEYKDDENMIYETIKNTFINQNVVFFGGYAISLYSEYMPKKLQQNIKKIPDFDVLSDEPQKTAVILKEQLEFKGIKNVKIIKRSSIGEIIADHYQIQIGNDTIAFIYKPFACHSYNMVRFGKEKIKIATIDTMLSFYLAFLYSNRDYYDVERIICMAQFLFQVQQHNRLEQKGLLRRFSINCYGHQETIEEMRAEKAEKFKELRGNQDTKEYEEWFLRYRPTDKKGLTKNVNTKKSTIKKKVNTKKSFTKKHKKTHKRGRGGLFY